MKILVFSDTHLTEKFEKKKFDILKKIISRAERVIINGDFWDGYHTTFDKFISSDWKKLFPLLKSKNTVYLFGNHDKESYIDQNVRLFSTLQTHRYDLQLNGKHFVFEHGNRLFPLFDERLPRLLNKVLSIIIGFIFQRVTLFNFVHKQMNEIIKGKIKSLLRENEILVCGHSHYAEYSVNDKFINTGHIEDGLAQYLFIDNGKIIPKEESYE